MTPHPGIGAGLETLLTLERYEVRRIARLSDRGALGSWRPDAVLVDAVVVHEGAAPFGVPTFVLAGTAADGELLARSLPDARGWLPKDLTAAELRRRVAPELRVGRGEARRATRLVLALVLILAVAICAYGTWLLYRAGV